MPSADALSILCQQATSALAAAADRTAITNTITAYISGAYRLGLSGAELIDAFCVSTPNIIEQAGLSPADADSAVVLFDSLHADYRRRHPGLP